MSAKEQEILYSNMPNGPNIIPRISVLFLALVVVGWIVLPAYLSIKYHWAAGPTLIAIMVLVGIEYCKRTRAWR